jgi:hypothetical protein
MTAKYEKNTKMSFTKKLAVNKIAALLLLLDDLRMYIKRKTSQHLTFNI